MRRRSFEKKLLSADTILITQSNGKFSRTHPKRSISKLISNRYLLLALVSLLLPWTVSGAGARNVSSPSPVQIVDVVPAKEASRGFASSFFNSRSGKSTGDDNALLANIDFLTQLTTSKQEKESEMDPLKCFPKALCGLSAESAAITRRRKNGLIADYIRLMKAVALNPTVMEKTLRKFQQSQDEQQLDDIDKESESEEDDEDEEDEDEEDDEYRNGGLIRRNGAVTGYGYGSAKIKPGKKATKVSSPSAPLLPASQYTSSPAPATGKPSKKRSKKETMPKDSDEFNKQFLFEKAIVEKLKEEGFYNEDADAGNWWAYENDKEESLEDLVDDSGGKLDSNSVEAQYTFGGKRKPSPPKTPYKPDAPPQPQTPQQPFVMQPQSPPPRPQPPQPPSVRVPASSSSSSDSSSSFVGSFFRTLFNFATSQSESNKDSFFQGFKRSLPDGTPTVVTVDKTKEILTTAIEIGETLRSPNQCNTLFNGCKFQYVELLHVIDDIRHSLADKGKDDFQTERYSTDEEIDNDSGGTKVGKKKNKHRSYGYQSSLSGTSQAETLSPVKDYTSAASKLTRKNKRRRDRKKKKSQHSSMSKESFEIGSDELTVYGSSHEHHADSSHRNKYGRKDGHSSQFHFDHGRPQHQIHSYHNNHQSQYNNNPYNNDRPKTFWGSVLSWFGFVRK